MGHRVEPPTSIATYAELSGLPTSRHTRSVPVRPKPQLTLEALQRNAILTGLEAPEAGAIVEAGTLAELAVRHPIYHPDEAIKDVFFPLDCVLSIVTRMEDGSQIEVGTIGREGVSAIPLLLGATTTANESYCQVPGTAVKIDAKLFQELKTNRKVRQLLDRHLQAYVNMLGQLAACNRLHNVYERCARWLLMTEDRVGSTTINLTHEFLAMMLGTQRSGVTIAVGTLQKAGFIDHARGIIHILDRPGLEAASCECYRVAREQFGGLLRSINGHNLEAAVSSEGTARTQRSSRATGP